MVCGKLSNEFVVLIIALDRLSTFGSHIGREEGRALDICEAMVVLAPIFRRPCCCLACQRVMACEADQPSQRGIMFRFGANIRCAEGRSPDVHAFFEFTSALTCMRRLGCVWRLVS